MIAVDGDRISPSDYYELRTLKREFLVHRAMLIIASLLSIGLLVLLLMYSVVHDSSLIFGLALFLWSLFLVYVCVLDSQKYKKLIINYLIKEYNKDLSFKYEPFYKSDIYISTDLLRESRLWGKLEDDEEGTFSRKEYAYELHTEDQFKSKAYPFLFFETLLAVTKIGRRGKTMETIFRGVVVEVKLTSVVDEMIVITSTTSNPQLILKVKDSKSNC